MWSYVRRLVAYVCKNWRTPDEGIWEARAARQHYTYSKMCVAFNHFITQS